MNKKDLKEFVKLYRNLTKYDYMDSEGITHDLLMELKEGLIKIFRINNVDFLKECEVLK